MAEPDKNFLQQWIDGVPGWKATFNQLQDSFGSLVAALVLVLAGIGFIWWISKDIRERPGVEWVIKRFKRKAIDKAPAGVLTIAVAHLQDDEGQKQGKLLLDELRHFDGVQTLSVDRMVEWLTSGTEHGKKNKAEEDARGLLRQNGADVLVWGSLISLSGKSAMRLYWTQAQDMLGAKSTEKSLPQTETLALPEAFWSDLKQILGLLTQTRLAERTFD
jgi:hypothetical protein